MRNEYRVLGPLEALVDGRPVKLGGPRTRGVLALLLVQANTVVPVGRLTDDLWPHDPPATAENLVQGYVSDLRKALGREAIETRGHGYVLHVQPETLDLHRFERLAHAGSTALASGRYEDAATQLREALACWRGPPLADLTGEAYLDNIVARLAELRLLALERRIDADLQLGRHADVVGELETLVREHPLRERPRGLLMLALYGSGRQAEALGSYRAARSTFVGELGIEPSEWLRGLEASMLRQDSRLEPAARAAPGAMAGPARSVLATSFDAAAISAIVAVAAQLARDPNRELLVVRAVSSGAELGPESARLTALAPGVAGADMVVRTAAFTSVTPGHDLARLATVQDVDLVLVDAPDRLLEDARLLTLLDQCPCDVAVLVGGRPGPGPVLVPFTGADHDWAAVELGAWLARSSGAPLYLAGATVGADGRDASRLLASASIVVQRALGIAAEPLLVDPTPDALVSAATDARIVCVGLTDRWRRDGLGAARGALAAQTAAPSLLVRRGVRPGGLAPRGSETRFTWTIGPGGL
jgi:DNA-binding SARP family transcriptional activator